MSSLLVTGGRIVTPEGVLDDGWVAVEDQRITGVGTGEPPTGADETVDVTGGWVVPGFVDIHCHGGAGESFGSEQPEGIAAAVELHRRHGTTTVLASLVSEPIPKLVRQVSVLAELAQDGLVAGIHLEGPFIAAARCGAHDPAVLRDPVQEDVRTLLDAGRGHVRMCTLAPELDGAVEAVRLLVDHGAVAAVGHTDATADQVLPAVDAGATVATHLFNGMRPLHHREPGPIGVLLDDERVTVELICDLVHLHPTVLRLAARHAGTGRTVLVTDAMSATGMGDGDYVLGELAVTVQDGVARLTEGGSLAGSTLTMDVAFRNLVHACGLTVPEAVVATATRPAALLGLSEVTGAIRTGLTADLVVLDEKLQLRRVLHRGSWVPGAGEP